MKKFAILSLVLIGLFAFGCQSEVKTYEPTWNSVREMPIPQWLRDGKFGIYTHWGPYAVHAFGSNTTWYSNALYMYEGSEARKHFEETFGELSPEYGYKDLIPLFTAEKFDADEWVALFKAAGAKFAGPVAEHHDGFAMWDTKYSDWNAAKMGPKRDVVGEFEAAVRKADMKFVTAFHHAANWDFFPVYDDRYDVGNPKYSGLYGQPHEQGAKRNQEFIDEWANKINEVIDNYSPDFIWFDFALDQLPEGYVTDFLAYYYNHAAKAGKEVVVTYKDNDIIPGAGVRDLELGQEPNITYHEWITDSSIDDRGAWGYANDLIFKSPNRLVDNLIDRVAKNGYLLLNVGPKPDGTIPEGAKEALLAMGKWMDINSEAIYGTTPWFIAGEGPTSVGEIQRQGFNESDLGYTPEDIRFTVKGDVLYASFLAWPGEKAVIKTLRQPNQADKDIPAWAAPSSFISLAGTVWDVKSPGSTDANPSHYEFYEDGDFKIISGGNGNTYNGKYEQDGTLVNLAIGSYRWTGEYDGKAFVPGGRGGSPQYPGFYKEEIKRITLLGDDTELDWVMTKQGLAIKTPPKQGEYAHVFKIERYHHPKFK